MTRTNVLPNDLASITLTEAQWSTIRTAVLCLAVDERCKGNHNDANYYLGAYNLLVDALNM
jgi:hypothetical protein